MAEPYSNEGNPSIASARDMDAGQQEFRRLILWAKENPQDWSRICHTENYHPDIEYVADLVERLYREKLYTLILVVLYANDYTRDVDWVISRTIHECFLDVPVSLLMERCLINLKLKAAEPAQNAQT